MDLIKHVAARIRELRTERGMSQEALGDSLGVATNTISRWETGVYKPALEDLDKLARQFEVSIMEFFPQQETPGNQEVAALLRAANSLPDDDLIELRRYAEFRRAQSMYRRVCAQRRGENGRIRMTRSEYYSHLKQMARDTRAKYGLTSPRVTLTDMRRIYKDQGIRIEYWSGPLKKVRGAYMNDDLGISVMVNRKLPAEQRIFTLAHELKHHLADQGLQLTEASDLKEQVEIGAEIFAAELIFPEQDFIAFFQKSGIGPGACKAEDVVRLKRETFTTLSFTSLGKRAEFLRLAPEGSLAKVAWKKLEESIYGEPDYKRIRRRIALRNASSE